MAKLRDRITWRGVLMVGAVFVLALGLIQFIPYPWDNPPVQAEPPWDSPARGSSQWRRASTATATSPIRTGSRTSRRSRG